MLRVYYLKVTDYDNIPESVLYKSVSEENRRITQPFRNEKVRRLKWLGESMVRNLTESEFGIQPGEYEIKKAAHGKPYIQGSPVPVFYNLSHSGNYLVCGLSDREIGVDIQQVGNYKSEIAQRFFHPNEILHLEKCETEWRTDLFFSYWSAKESFLKYTGTGLTASLAGFEIIFEGKDIQIAKPDFHTRVYMKECRIEEDYKCFVCSEYPEMPEIFPFVFTEG